MRQSVDQQGQQLAIVLGDGRERQFTHLVMVLSHLPCTIVVQPLGNLARIKLLRPLERHHRREQRQQRLLLVQDATGDVSTDAAHLLFTAINHPDGYAARESQALREIESYIGEWSDRWALCPKV